MEGFRVVLEMHLKKYPLMGPEDCAKLIYQGEFAGEHMIASPEQSLERIRAELDNVQPAEGVLYESIGGGVARLHFGPAKAAGMGAEEINRAFTAAPAAKRGSREGQQEKLRLLIDLCREGKTAFSPVELESFMKEYQAAGCPALHHSDRYRQEYSPHYRVIYTGE